MRVVFKYFLLLSFLCPVLGIAGPSELDVLVDYRTTPYGRSSYKGKLFLDQANHRAHLAFNVDRRGFGYQYRIHLPLSMWPALAAYARTLHETFPSYFLFARSAGPNSIGTFSPHSRPEFKVLHKGKELLIEGADVSANVSDFDETQKGIRLQVGKARPVDLRTWRPIPFKLGDFLEQSLSLAVNDRTYGKVPRLVPVHAFEGPRGMAYVLPALRMNTEVMPRLLRANLEEVVTPFFAVPITALRMATSRQEYEQAFTSDNFELGERLGGAPIYHGENKLGVVPVVFAHFADRGEQVAESQFGSLVQHEIRRAMEETSTGTHVLRFSELLPENRLLEEEPAPTNFIGWCMQKITGALAGL